MDKLLGWFAGRPMLSLALVVLVTHGLALLHPGVHLDGWPMYFAGLSHNPSDGAAWFILLGSPLTALFHYVMLSLPVGILGYKAVAVASLVVATLACQRVLARARAGTEAECWAAAALTQTWTAFALISDVTYAPHAMLWAMFFLALLALDRALHGDRFRLGYRVLGWLLLFPSFTFNSLLVFFYGIVAAWIFEGAPTMAARIRRGLSVLDLGLVPIAYWIFNRTYYPPKGEWARYNQFVPSGLITSGVRFIDYVVNRAPALLCREIAADPWPFLLPAALAAYAAWRLVQRRGQADEGGAQGDQPSAAPLRWLWLAAVAAAPYALVGKEPIPRDWESRHIWVASLPVSMLLVLSTRRLRAPQRAAVLGALLALGAMSNAQFHLFLQARWVKDMAIVENLKLFPREVAERYSLFIFDDHFNDDRSLIYGAHDYSALFYLAWGDTRHMGARSPVDLHPKPPQPSRLFKVDQVDMEGCRAFLTVYRSRWKRTDLGMATLGIGLLGAKPETRAAKLREVVGLSVAPFDGAQGKHCQYDELPRAWSHE